MKRNENTGKKLKIGILIRDVDKLDNWEYRILQGILEHPDLELALFIKDGREQLNSFKSRVKRNLLTPAVVSNILFALQMAVESFSFKKKKTVDANDIINKTKDVKTIYLKPQRKGFLDIFSAEDAEKVKAYDLDIILRHEFNIIHGDILTASRHGIWSYHHADNAINRGGPAGFWEIVNKEPCCGVTLQQLTPELDGGLVIDKAWFNRHWSFFNCNNELLEKSVVLLFKNINKLLLQGKVETTKSLTYYNRLYKRPGLNHLLIYMVRFYCTALARAFGEIYPFKRAFCWTLSFGKGNFLEAALFKTTPVSIPKKVFWADPFLYEYENQPYVFFENYSYKKKRGIISAGKVMETGKNKFSVVDVQDILELECHLSYPQIFEENGEIFLIPEMFGRERIEVYKCARFPDKWELYSTAFEGESIVDTTYFVDENGEKWLLLNKGWTFESELYIYKIDSLKLENIIPHKQNPVIIDCRKGRNGGSIFKYKGEYYRPGQTSVHGIYGNGLNISKIKKLTLDEFEDEDIISIKHNFKKGLTGIHHLHQIENSFVFDSCYKRL